MSKNESCKKIDVNIDDLVKQFYDLFNDPISVSESMSNYINQGINDVIFENFTPILVSCDELNKALKQTIISNVCGNDGISSNMLLNCDSNFITSRVLYFF